MSFLAPIIIIVLIFIFVVLFVGFTLLRGILSIVFPFLRPKSRPFQAGGPFSTQRNKSENKDEYIDEMNEEKKLRKKIFEKEDGEYVDFEEYEEKE